MALIEIIKKMENLFYLKRSPRVNQATLVEFIFLKYLKFDEYKGHLQVK